MKTLKVIQKKHLKLIFGTVLMSSAICAQADQVILDDLIVNGSVCAGQDCVNGESFGFDTLRLKENNLRIRFQDTSSSASFPTNDWQLTANDSANGGANKFSIDDIDGGRTPFTIEAGAPSHSLYVDDGGRLGLGTSTPVVDIHVKSGNTPTLRLEQDGSSGFGAQTWDVAGNEANFFVRDATNGSTLPFRIFPGAPSNSISVAADGDVGMRTTSPNSALHVLDTNGSSDGNRSVLTLENPGKVMLSLNDTVTTNGEWRLMTAGSVLNFNNFGGDGHEFALTHNGNLTISGTLTESSSRDVKENIFKVDNEEILETVTKLPIAKWNYISDGDSIKHVGPMAQDFYALFGLGKGDTGIASLDTSGIALASIQALNKKMSDKSYEMEQLKEENRVLQNKLARLETIIFQIVTENEKRH